MRHLTEIAVRRGVYWTTGGKRLISSCLHHCVPSRKLSGKTEHQKMSDLHADLERLAPSPPYSFVGEDVFGPWTIENSKTSGDSANSKRWAVIFSWLVTHSVHIDLIEKLNSYSFINALRRFISLRWPVVEFRIEERILLEKPNIWKSMLSTLKMNLEQLSGKKLHCVEIQRTPFFTYERPLGKNYRHFVVHNGINV